MCKANNERRYNCYDCETYHVWRDGEEAWAPNLIIPPHEGSGIPEQYCYCETTGAVVDMAATPEDNCCDDFEKAGWRL